MKIKIKLPQGHVNLPAPLQMMAAAASSVLPEKDAAVAYIKNVGRALLVQPKEQVELKVAQDILTALASYAPLVSGIATQFASTMDALRAGHEHLASLPEETQNVLKALFMSKGGAKALVPMTIDLGSNILSQDEEGLADFESFIAQVTTYYNATMSELSQEPRLEAALRAFSAVESEMDAETAYWTNIFQLGEYLSSSDENYVATARQILEDILQKHGGEKEGEKEVDEVEELFSFL